MERQRQDGLQHDGNNGRHDGDDDTWRQKRDNGNGDYDAWRHNDGEKSATAGWRRWQQQENDDRTVTQHQNDDGDSWNATSGRRRTGRNFFSTRQSRPTGHLISYGGELFNTRWRPGYGLLAFMMRVARRILALSLMRVSVDQLHIRWSRRTVAPMLLLVKVCFLYDLDNMSLVQNKVR